MNKGLTDDEKLKPPYAYQPSFEESRVLLGEGGQAKVYKVKSK